MPTRKAGDEILENRVRFKNLLDEAQEQLVEGGMRQPEAKQFLSPARALVEDELFWQRQDSGLAVFLAEGLARKYRLPLDFDELVVVSDRFHVKPLLQVMSSNGRFYVLALSQHETRLLQGTRHRIGEINLDEREQVPHSIVDILKWEDPEMRLQQATGTESTLHHGVSAIFHGHGVASQDDPKQKVLRYFQRLDEGISDLLADDDAPLVVVGDDFLLPLYREANSYPPLTEEGVGVEPQQLSAGELHQQAWSIVHPLFEQAQERARDVYKHLEGTESERATNDVEEIVRAAYFERVEGLFVAADAQRWGTFDPETGEATLHDEQQPGDRDLLSLSAVHTMLNEGWLFVVDGEEVPNGAPAAAILRY
jgi:hypothetical protein